MNPISRIRRVTLAGIAAICALAAPALARHGTITPVPSPAEPSAIALGTGPLPGATATESWHRQYGSLFARNVTVATLTPYLPDPSNASGAVVVHLPSAAYTSSHRELSSWR